jgi:hypothetical protein
MDINDPANPYGRVKLVEIACTIQYKGDDAWNQNILLPKLENFLRANGYDLRGYKPTHYFDDHNNEIKEDEFKDYVYTRHGHIHGKCSSCPDPVKWRAAEKLARKIQAEQGGLTKKKKYRTRTVYVMETKEERALRKKIEEGKEIDIDFFELVKGGGNRVEEL